jgi:hypothetical protein
LYCLKRSRCQALTDLERLKNGSSFWSSWATSDDFAQQAKKQWESSFLKAMIGKVPEIEGPILSIRTENSNLQKMKSARK